MRSSNKKMVLMLCAIAVAAAFPAVVVAQEQSEEMNIVLAAEQLLQQQKPQEALAEAQKALEIDDEFAPAFFISGHAYLALNQPSDAFDAFVKAAQFNPGWGLAHRFASMAAADIGNLDDSWDQAIKAHQAGTDMEDAFAGLKSMTTAPEDLDAQLAVARVFIGPLDTEVFEQQGDTALSGGANSAASDRTDVGARVVAEAAADLFQFQQEARRQVSQSRTFGLVQRQDMANLIMVVEVDSIGDNVARRPMRAVIKLVDAQSGEEAFRRRVEFSNIVSRSDLNRDFSTIMRFMEEWAAEQRR